MIAVRKAEMLLMKNYKFARCVYQVVGSLKREKYIEVIFLTPYKSHDHSNSVPGSDFNVGVQLTCTDLKV